MSDNDDLYGDSVYEGGVEDAEDRDPAENLTGDGIDLDEPQDTGYSPPEHRPAATRYGVTAAEQAAGESLDQRLAEEEPDIDPDAPGPDNGDAEDFDPAERRAGRLVAPDEGAHGDDESDAVARDAGLAGSAASAEEAAVHVIDEDELDEDALDEDQNGGYADPVLESDSVDD